MVRIRKKVIHWINECDFQKNISLSIKKTISFLDNCYYRRAGCLHSEHDRLLIIIIIYIPLL